MPTLKTITGSQSEKDDITSTRITKTCYKVSRVEQGLPDED